jgi:hypothetical protein
MGRPSHFLVSGDIGFDEGKKLVPGEDFYCQEQRGRGIILFVAMEIMSAHSSRIYRVGAIVCGIFLLTGLQSFAQQSPAYGRNFARFSAGARIDDNLAQVALISDHPTFGYTLPEGTSELVLSLSKIQNFDVITFANRDSVGTVSVSTSNSKLAAASSQWHQVARQNLTLNVTKIKVGPTEAKYVKFTFKVSKAGRIADLGVFSTAIPNLMVANTALAGGSEGAADGKDAKDFAAGKDAKEAKEVAEGPPGEGPPPTLPDPPPFVFVPEISP